MTFKIFRCSKCKELVFIDDYGLVKCPSCGKCYQIDFNKIRTKKKVSFSEFIRMMDRPRNEKGMFEAVAHGR